jgi:hypothetical protein
MIEVQGKEYPTVRGLMLGIRARLKKQGWDISTWHQGRVTMRSTHGLEVTTDLWSRKGEQQFLNSVRVVFNNRYKHCKQIDMNEVYEYIKSLGLEVHIQDDGWGNKDIYIPHSEWSMRG